MYCVDFNIWKCDCCDLYLWAPRKLSSFFILFLGVWEQRMVWKFHKSHFFQPHCSFTPLCPLSPRELTLLSLLMSETAKSVCCAIRGNLLNINYDTWTATIKPNANDTHRHKWKSKSRCEKKKQRCMRLIEMHCQSACNM